MVENGDFAFQGSFGMLIPVMLFAALEFLMEWDWGVGGGVFMFPVLCFPYT